MQRSDADSRQRADGLLEFVELAGQLLASRDESQRRVLEDRLLDLLPATDASGLFELVEIRDPALRAMLRDR